MNYSPYSSPLWKHCFKEYSVNKDQIAFFYHRHSLGSFHLSIHIVRLYFELTILLILGHQSMIRIWHGDRCYSYKHTASSSTYLFIYYYGCHRKYHIEYIAGAIFWSEKKFHVCYCCVMYSILCTTCRQVSLSLPNEYTSMSVSISSTIPVSTMGAAFHYRSSSCDFLSIMK